MRNLVLFFIGILFFSSCTNSSKDEDNFGAENTTKKETRTPDFSEAFLDLFCYTNSDNLHIYSPDEKKEGKKYTGKKIDPIFYSYLRINSTYKNLLKDSSDYFYACYKMGLSNNTTGLIIRRGSQYDETAIDLLVWDNTLQKIINQMEIVDSFGDGAWFFVRDAWLTDVNNDKKNDIVQKEQSYDEESEETNQEIQKEFVKVYLNSGSKFVLSKLKVDSKKYTLHNRVF